jgi:hypothetical protein
MEMGTGKEGARLLPTMPGAARVFGGIGYNIGAVV